MDTYRVIVRFLFVKVIFCAFWQVWVLAIIEKVANKKGATE